MPPSPFQGLLGYAGSGEPHPSPSSTECSGPAPRPTLWKEQLFCFLFSHKEHFEVSSDQDILNPSTCPSPTWWSSRPM